MTDNTELTKALAERDQARARVAELEAERDESMSRLDTYRYYLAELRSYIWGLERADSDERVAARRSEIPPTELRDFLAFDPKRSQHAATEGLRQTAINGMTAAECATAYLDARDELTRRGANLSDQIAKAKNGGQPWARLTVTGLRAILAEHQQMSAAIVRISDMPLHDHGKHWCASSRDLMRAIGDAAPEVTGEQIAGLLRRLAARSRAKEPTPCGPTPNDLLCACGLPLFHDGAKHEPIGQLDV